MATKHDQILKHIEGLTVGDRISVRSIAKNLGVSEGTAYRAIKDAENMGLVSTIQRVGTIRIERKLKKNIERLTFDEVVKIVEGEVLGGEAGLEKSLHKFVIGAMTKEAMIRYITPDSLMIVGNRSDVQALALKEGAAVLVTGGFAIEHTITALADKLALPVIGTTYDTFTVATLINRALSDQLIKKDIMLVEDIYTPIKKTNYLLTTDTIADYQRLGEETGHSRFPIVNRNKRLVGIVAAKDVLGKNLEQTIDKAMTKEPIAVKRTMSVASVSHQMIWDGFEVMPVVADDETLVGIVSRQDVMKAMQVLQRQTQIEDTIPDQIASEITDLSDPEDKEHTLKYGFTVTPQTINSVGTLAFGILSEVVSSVAQLTMYAYEKRNILIEQINLHYFHLIQIDNKLEIRPKVLDIGRRNAKLDIEVYLDHRIVAKAIVICQLIEKP